jgi:hypothetical protein
MDRRKSQGPEINSNLHSNLQGKESDSEYLERLRRRNGLIPPKGTLGPAEVGNINDIRQSRELKAFISIKKEIEENYKISEETYQLWQKFQAKFVEEYEPVNSQIKAHNDKTIKETFTGKIKEYRQDKLKLRQVRDQFLREYQQAQRRIDELSGNQNGNYNERLQESNEIKTKQIGAIETYILHLTVIMSKYENTYNDILSQFPS